MNFDDTERLASESGAFPDSPNLGLGHRCMHQEQNSLCRVKVMTETVLSVNVEARASADCPIVCKVGFFSVRVRYVVGRFIVRVVLVCDS